MREGDTYWDRSTRHFMTVEDARPHAVASRLATHEEIKALLDGAMKGWADVLAAMRRMLGDRA
jgi:hypothetical protein